MAGTASFRLRILHSGAGHLRYCVPSQELARECHIVLLTCSDVWCFGCQSASCACSSLHGNSFQSAFLSLQRYLHNLVDDEPAWIKHAVCAEHDSVGLGCVSGTSSDIFRGVFVELHSECKAIRKNEPGTEAS